MLDRLSIRWRLALITAALTLAILSAFAVTIGQLMADRVRSDFQNELAAAVDRLSDRLEAFNYNDDSKTYDVTGPRIDAFAAGGNAVVRVLAASGRIIEQTREAPNFGIQLPRSTQVSGYRVETRERYLPLRGGGRLSLLTIVQYARPVSDLESTVRQLRLFLLLGVVLGTLLALVGSLLLARRALQPIAGLTATARAITRTRDPGRRVPRPATDDEVGELAGTLQEMLDALARSRAETEEALERQRQFVADASHELRTPLTSTLANLELLADVLAGEAGEAARSALRSSQRMKRLVGDLLLLARADAERVAPHRATDLADVVAEAAAELAPVAEHHVVTLDAGPAVVAGVRDELHRLALNLLENAVSHTPPGTQVRAVVRRRGDVVRLSIEDDGPGVPPELRGRIFERFVRGTGDRGGSFGLGLSIVRAVAESHGGSVRLEDARPGARFVVELPAVPLGPAGSDLDDDRQHHRAPA